MSAHLRSIGFASRRTTPIGRTEASGRRALWGLLLAHFASVGIHEGKRNDDDVLEEGTQVTRDQVRQIAETKMPDLNATDIDGAMKMIAGTARSMGIEVEG